MACTGHYECWFVYCYMQIRVSRQVHHDPLFHIGDQDALSNYLGFEQLCQPRLTIHEHERTRQLCVTSAPCKQPILPMGGASTAGTLISAARQSGAPGIACSMVGTTSRTFYRRNHNGGESFPSKPAYYRPHNSPILCQVIAAASAGLTCIAVVYRAVHGKCVETRDWQRQRCRTALTACVQGHEQ